MPRSPGVSRKQVGEVAAPLVDEHPSRSLTTTNNGDEVLNDLLEHPVRFTAHLLSSLASDVDMIRELAEVHLLNLSATNTTCIRPLAQKWTRVSAQRLPAKRTELGPMLNQLRDRSPQSEDLSLANTALAFFELMFMASAPVLFTKDYWVQYLGGGVIHWLPTPSTRLLPINALVAIVRHNSGKSLLTRWKDLGFQSQLLESLEYIQHHGHWCSSENGTLGFATANDGNNVLSAARCQPVTEGSISLDCSRVTINANSVKKNGHLLLQGGLSHFDLLCVQETRFRDQHHASHFTFHAQALDARCFINDVNNNDSPVRVPRQGCVATIVKSTFPGASTVTRERSPGTTLSSSWTQILEACMSIMYTLQWRTRNGRASTKHCAPKYRSRPKQRISFSAVSTSSSKPT